MRESKLGERKKPEWQMLRATEEVRENQRDQREREKLLMH